MLYPTLTAAVVNTTTTLAPRAAVAVSPIAGVETTAPAPQIATETTGPLVTTGIKPNGGEIAKVKTLSNRQRAGRRQEVMWAITEDKNLAGCHRWSRGGEVGISYSEGGASSYVGLQNTGSRWCSPLAELEVMADRRTELALGVKNWLAGGGSIIMGVGTVRHNRFQSHEQVLGGLKSAYESMVDGTWSKDRKHYGIVHYYADYEYTWSKDNGHHPHKNMILFVEGSLSELELEALGDSMFGRWSAGAVKGGLEAPLRKRGMKLEQVTAWGSDAAMAAVYLAKGMAAEFTGAATKEAYNGSLTSFQILDVLADQRDAEGRMEPRLVAVYREYEANFKALRSSWSRGAKKALGIDHITKEQAEELAVELAALTGEEREERTTKTRWMIAGIPSAGSGSEWSKVSGNMALRSRVLEAVEQGRTRAEAQRNALVLLAEFGVEAVPRMVSMEAFDLEALGSHTDALVRDLGRHVLEAV